MTTKSAFRDVAVQGLIGLVIAAIAFGVIWTFFPKLIDAITTSAELLRIEPSSTFVCSASNGEKVRATFSIRNVSGRGVKILGARSHCGCTTVGTVFPIYLAPGATDSISLDITVGNPEADGKFRSETSLFVDREGAVPSLKLEASVFASAPPI